MQMVSLKVGSDWQYSSEIKGAWLQAWQTELHLRIHVVKGKNWLLKIIFWPPNTHMCAHACMRAHTHIHTQFLVVSSTKDHLQTHNQTWKLLGIIDELFPGLDPLRYTPHLECQSQLHWGHILPEDQNYHDTLSLLWGLRWRGTHLHCTLWSFTGMN